MAFLIAFTSFPILSFAQEVRLESDQIYYDGYISKEGILKVEQALKHSASNIQWLNITSKGGDIKLGMALGLLVFNNQLNIRVEEYCLSSCANYIFTAGNRKELGKHGLIGFHGGASSTRFDESQIESVVAGVPDEQREGMRLKLEASIRSNLKLLNRDERIFYNEIGVNREVTTYGQREEFETKNGFEGWYYPIVQIEKFGVSNIHLIEGYWEYKDPAPSVSFFKIDHVDL